MSRTHVPKLGVLLFLLASAFPSSAQSNSPPPIAPDPTAYLLRLERARDVESVCVLLNASGRYHLERHTPRKVRVFEGTASDVELRDIVRIVSADQLFHLEQKQIPDLMMKSDDDHFIVEVHRPGAWQQLLFPDSASRLPFRETLDPLLAFLESVNKRKGREFSEEAGRNNCLPPSSSEFAKRDAARAPEKNRISSKIDPVDSADAPAQPQNPYLLLMYETRLLGYRPQVTCLVVSAAGGYHMVTQIKSYEKGLSNAVLDGTLSPPQLGTLRSLLDAPELANQPEEIRQGEIMMTMDGFYTRLFIPRGPATQHVAAWKSYRLINQVLTRDVEDHGTKVLAPLRGWLKSNIDEKAAIPTPMPHNPRCIPGG